MTAHIDRLQNRAEDVRIEVDLILGVPHSMAGDETKRNYLTLAGRDIEHWKARERAILAAAGALISRAQVAQIEHPEVADRYIRQARRLHHAFAEGQAMADAVSVAKGEVA